MLANEPWEALLVNDLIGSADYGVCVCVLPIRWRDNCHSNVRQSKLAFKI